MRIKVPDGCALCSLAKTRGHEQPIVNNFQRSPEWPYELNSRPDVLVIGQAPGKEEASQQMPFCGPAGRLLRGALAACWQRPVEEEPLIVYTNTCLCYPPGDRVPTEEEASICSGFARAHIALMRPKVILAVGSIAVRVINDIGYSTKFRMGDWSGVQTFWVATLDNREEKIPIFNLYHPSYLLRQTNQNKREELKSHYEESLQKMYHQLSKTP